MKSDLYCVLSPRRFDAGAAAPRAAAVGWGGRPGAGRGASLKAPSRDCRLSGRLHQAVIIAKAINIVPLLRELHALARSSSCAAYGRVARSRVIKVEYLTRL